MSNMSSCIRCGKLRIVGKTWTEKVAGSLVTFSTTVCPDPACQKIVAEQLQDKKERIEKIQSESLKRRSNIRRGKQAAKKN